MAVPTPPDDLDRLFGPSTSRTPSEERLAAVLQTLRVRMLEQPDPGVSAAHLQAIYAAVSATEHTAVLAAPHELGSRMVRRSRRRREARLRSVVVAAALTLLTVTGLAAAGTLPAPFQRAVSDTARLVGIDLPSPGRGASEGPAAPQATPSASAGSPGLTDPADPVAPRSLHAGVPDAGEPSATPSPVPQRRPAPVSTPDGPGGGGSDPAVPSSEDGPPPASQRPPASQQPEDEPGSAPPVQPPNDDLVGDDPPPGPPDRPPGLPDHPPGAPDPPPGPPDRAPGPPTETPSREPGDGPALLAGVSVQGLAEGDRLLTLKLTARLGGAEGASRRCDQRACSRH